jgi:hypothetical protein
MIRHAPQSAIGHDAPAFAREVLNIARDLERRDVERLNQIRRAAEQGDTAIIIRTVNLMLEERRCE